MLFESKNGIKYTYDNNSGQIFCCENKDEKTVIDYYMHQTWKYKDLPIKNVTSGDVQRYLINEGNGFKQLIFELTSQCNLRCKYCCYSECYEMTHGYSDEYMSFDTAKKAIDYYVANYEKTTNRNPLAELYISFYGGEPLLNIKLIREIINYLETQYACYQFSYNITTNGLLFTKKVYDYLVKKDVAILVSLDGNEKDHDRNRVDINGKPTFQKVMNNIRSFLKDYPEYEKFSISACYDWKSDLLETEKFFESEGIPITKFSLIDTANTTYYERFSLKDIEYYNKQIEILKNKMVSLAREEKLTEDTFVYQTFGIGYLEFAYHTMIGDSRNPLIPYTGTCVPGEKLYVTPDGKMHVCEKINPNYSIGDVENGLDYERISEMINCYNESISVHCKNCDVSKLCSNCFTRFAGEKGFNYSQEKCALYRKNVKSNLEDLVTLLEANPGILEKLTVGYYEFLMKHVKEC